ncbi:MAG TPA: flagellar motor protein MotB [Roseomonas sp.]|jgi:chemotaxis protein MotB
MSAKRRGRGGGTIIIKREESGEHAHHGGAWKVAYADFVTAMMAFFLLMWLLNATDEEKRRGLADYFSQANLLGRGTSGSGEPFGGRTPHDPSPMTSSSGAPRIQTGQAVVLDIEEDDSDTPATPIIRREGPLGNDEDAEARRTQATPDGARDGPAPARTGPAASPAERPDPEQLTDVELRAEQTRREQAAFDQAADQIRQAVAADPALADLARQLVIEQVPEGMRIQLLDAERQPMFALGGAAPNDRSRALIARVAQVIQRLPNAIAIAGHTDATQFRGAGSNWDLSADRANATRRLLTEAGVAEARMRSVAGMADRDPLIADQPNAAANRRVSITLIRQAAPEPRS